MGWGQGRGLRAASLWRRLVQVLILAGAGAAQEDDEEASTSTTVLFSTTVSTSWVQGTLYPDRYECDTLTCAAFNDWDLYPVNTTNTTRACEDVHAELVNGQNFLRQSPDTCRRMKAVGMKYEKCRSDYCDYMESAVQKIYHVGGPGYYGFDECRPLLNFNRTLCETEYRDVEIFCDCYCPMLPLLETVNDCEEEILDFLVLGRRSPELQRRYPMSQQCAQDLCSFFEEIGNPSPVNPPDIAFGVPDQCHTVGLPYRKEMCQRMIITSTSAEPVMEYNPCPWLVPGTKDDVITCADGSTHEISNTEVDSWNVCMENQFRWQCPANYPVMCEGTNCDASEDHCCQTSVDRCRTGEERMCSPALIEDLPEWRGYLTPSATVSRGTTTTMDPLDAYLQISRKPTTTPENMAGKVEDVLPNLVIGAGSAGAVLTLAMMLFLCKSNVKRALSAVTGAPRLMKAYRTDPVNVFEPTGCAVDPDARAPLPPLRTKEEVETERLDNLACEALKHAIFRCELRGMDGLCQYHGCPPPKEEDPLIEAMAVVRERGIESMDKNAGLLAKGDKWIQTLRAERFLMKVAHETMPALQILGHRPEMPVTGIPWSCTQKGQLHQNALQTEAWSKVESLNTAIKAAKAAGAQDALIKTNANLLAELVARTPELPADRVVLDPEGEGLKLLPEGNQRAIQPITGEYYMYETNSRVATDVTDLPAREDLGAVNVDPARPVCAEWVKHHKCKNGRRCPWRHEQPRPGDAVRESILAREDDR